jgi:hypothetical protein
VRDAELGCRSHEKSSPKHVGHDTGVIADHPAHDSLETPRLSAAARGEKVISRILRGEQWRTRRRIVLLDAMLDSPPLFRIEFFEIGEGHWLRISMEAGDP